jgi:pre-mRNA-processing factor SLU7
MRSELKSSLQNINIEQYYKRGLVGQASQKFRTGACENCGAITHKTKGSLSHIAECFERPRKLKAKYTGENLAPDELFKEI